MDYEYRCPNPNCNKLCKVVDEPWQNNSLPAHTLIPMVGCEEKDNCGFASDQERAEFKEGLEEQARLASYSFNHFGSKSKEQKSEMLKKRSKHHAATKGKEYRQAVKMGEAGRKNLL